jgi:5'-nucleotidase
MKTRPKLLITNDDGIHAPGIKHLWHALKDVADITIIAPSAEQSSVGLATTIRQPLLVNKVVWPENTPAWSVSGTPSDCVKLGLNMFLKERPDIIVSGINRGQNAGRNVLYSGTIGGIIEGILHDIPGIAFSTYDYDEPNFSTDEVHIPKLVNYVLSHPLPLGTLLNVNFPSRHLDFKGVKMTRQGKGYWGENPEQRPHPSEGHHYYWLGAKYLASEEHEEADIYLLEQGFVTATPVHVSELTDHKHYSAFKSHFESHFSH